MPDAIPAIHSGNYRHQIGRPDRAIASVQSIWTIRLHGQGGPGSIVVDEDDCVLGLIVALQAANPLQPDPQDPAFVVAITDVLSALDLEFTGPNRHCAIG
jgi:hypothetical protein